MKCNTFQSRCDTLIAVLCLVFLLTSLGSVGGIGRTRARDFLCRSHLQQWASIFDSCTLDNDGFFPTLGASDSGRWWIEMLWPYARDAGLLACPAAMNASPYVQSTHRAWSLGQYAGSYGVSGWIGNRAEVVSGHRGAPTVEFWQTPRVRGAAGIPVLADMFWVDAWPYTTDSPPAMEQSLNVQGTNEMRRVCVNRHAGSTNFLFADASVRQVGLKEIWALKWHKTYNTMGPWTVAGGVRPTDWPEWMRQFKDFYDPALDDNP